MKALIEEIQKLRQLFQSQKFADYQVGDMTIRIDGEPVEGAKVFVVDAEGNVSPAPDGEHNIPDMGVITTMGGVIVAPQTEVAAADTTDAAAAVEEVAAVVEEIAPEAPAETVAAVSAEAVAEIMEKLTAMESEMVEMKKKMMGYQEREKQMFAVIEKLASEPSAPETDTNALTQHFSKAPKNDMAEVIKIVQNFKNKPTTSWD